MAERRYPAYTPGGGAAGRSATFNPARASMPVMPSSLGYNPGYPGDIHSYPTAPSRYANGSPRYHYNPPPPHPRGHGGAFTLTDDAPPRSSRARDPVPSSTRTRRSSTVDSAHPRPIIITTNTPSSRTHGHNPPARDRSRSPPRDDYRPVDSSIRPPRASSRTRGTGQHGVPAPPYSPTFDVNDDEYVGRGRGPEITPASGRADAYRNSRPTVVYPSNPRHTTVDIGDQYGYTKPGELAQYDLDHPQQHSRHRRHESFDHYARPNIYYNPERRGFNIETHRTHDGSGPSAKSSDVRGGPPPTTWGLDKLNRSSTAYETAPPAAPVPPSPLRPEAIQINPRERRGSNRHVRPVSLYQEAPPRPARDDGFYRARDDERPLRRERDNDHGAFIDDYVTNRGFGIRTEPVPQTDDRREKRERVRKEYADSARRPDDDYDRDWERIERAEAHDLEDGRERRRRQPRATHDDERDGDAEVEGARRLKDNLKAGLGLAASAVGLGHKSGKPEHEDRETTTDRTDKQDKKDRERRRKDPEEESAAVFSSDDDDDDVEIISARASDRYRPRDKVYASKDRHGRDRDRRESTGASDVVASGSGGPREGDRDVEDADRDSDLVQPPRDGTPPNEESNKGRKKDRLSSFNPNDAEDLDDIKEKLANMKVYDQDNGGGERVVVVEPLSDPNLKEAARSERSVSSRRDPSSSGRRDVVLSPESKSVRVVSPPPWEREKPETKPIKGILKTPSSRFPEDPNPIREGVAPHKNDEKLKAVPPGARWTRISRKIVNPDALEKGQERYEVRDDFVIVLRVLSREEIEAYATLTAKLRGEILPLLLPLTRHAPP